jgi:hypothetical protein
MCTNPYVFLIAHLKLRILAAPTTAPLGAGSHSAHIAFLVLGGRAGLKKMQHACCGP